MTREDKKWGLITIGIIGLIVASVYVGRYYHDKGVLEYKEQMDQRTQQAYNEEAHVLDNLVKAYSGDITMARAIEMEKKYEIVAKSGDKEETIEYAGKVAAAYLEADDETSYLKWKGIQKQLSEED